MSSYDSLTTRMPQGLTNAAPWQTMGASGVPDPTWAHTYANDFDTYTPGDWTVTLVGTGTQTLTDSNGGALLVTNSAGATDATYMRLKNAGFMVGGGKATFFKFMASTGTVATNLYQFFAGLTQSGATTLASITNGIYISKATGSTQFMLNITRASVTTSFPFPANLTVGINSPFEIGFMVDYLGNVAGFWNPTTGSNPISASPPAPGAATATRGRVVSTGTPPLNPAVPLPTVLLAPAFGLMNGATTATPLTIDYIVVSDER